MACCGDVATMEALAATALLRQHFPELKLRFVNVVDLFRLVPSTEHPHGFTDYEFDALFTTDKPIIFNFHTYPWLTYRRTNHHNLHVRGYKERGNVKRRWNSRSRTRSTALRWRSTQSTGCRRCALTARTPGSSFWDGRSTAPTMRMIRGRYAGNLRLEMAGCDDRERIPVQRTSAILPPAHRLPRMLDAAIAARRDVVGVTFMQLDDLAADRLPALAPALASPCRSC